VVGVLTRQIDPDGSDRYRTASVDTIGFMVNEAASAPVGWFGRDLAPTLRALLKELLKQAIDQPGHFLIAAAPIWASRYLVGVPWFGWVAAPILAYREWLQWPSRRWWDPPLDWAFLTLGAVAATWGRRGGDAFADGLAAFGRRLASGFVVRGRMPQRV